MFTSMTDNDNGWVCLLFDNIQNCQQKPQKNGKIQKVTNFATQFSTILKQKQNFLNQTTQLYI